MSSYYSAMATHESPFKFTGSAKAGQNQELSRSDGSAEKKGSRSDGPPSEGSRPVGGPSTNTRSKTRPPDHHSYGSRWEQYYCTDGETATDGQDGACTDQGSSSGVYKPKTDLFAIEWTVLVNDEAPGAHVWNPELIRHALQLILPYKINEVVLTSDHSAILFFGTDRGGLERDQVEPLIDGLSHQDHWIGTQAEVWPRRVPLASARKAAKQAETEKVKEDHIGRGDAGLGIPFPGRRSGSPHSNAPTPTPRSSPRRRRGRRPTGLDRGSDPESDAKSGTVAEWSKTAPKGRARLPTFEGGDPSAYRQWRYDLNLLLKLGYSEQILYPEVLTSLKGRPGGVARTLTGDQAPTLREIVRRLDTYYGGSLTFFSMSRSMHQLTQAKDECVGDFASRINDHLNMMRGSHPEDMKSFETDKAMREVLFNGFNTRMKWALRYLMRQPGMTAEDLLAEAQEMEQEEISDRFDRANRTAMRDPKDPATTPKPVGNGYYARKPKPAAAAVRAAGLALATLGDIGDLSGDEELVPEVEETPSEPDELESRTALAMVAAMAAFNRAEHGRPAPTTVEKGLCYLCKKPGHLMHECPQMKKLQEMAATLSGNAKGGTTQKGGRNPPEPKIPASARSVQSEPSEQ